MTKSVAAISLEDRISSMKKDRGSSVSIDEIGTVVGSLVNGAKTGETGSPVTSEMQELLDFISEVKTELNDLQPKSLANRDIHDAHIELDAVIAATDDAAGKIMNAADEIGAMAEEVEGEAADKLIDISTRMFEASSFQDITGQRITKVTKVLELLEDKLNSLANKIGDDYVRPSEEERNIERDEWGVVVNDEDLLHGPQLEGEGNSQAEIDALLASFD